MLGASIHGRLNWKAAIVPRLKPTSERPDFVDPSSLQQQRHPGAGSFVRSRAKQDDLAVARNLIVIGVQLLGGKPDRTGNRPRRRLEVE